MRPKNRGYWPETKEVDRRKKEKSLAAQDKNNENPEQNFLRRQDQKSTVTDLVYKYLRKVAYTDSVRKQRNNACSKFRKGNARRKTIHPPRRYTSAENSEVKSYLRKALSFAVDSGYLIPTDQTGKILRISPNMLISKEKQYKTRRILYSNIS